MADKRDYYEVLGLKKNASDSDIKSAYRKLAMKWHPDRCKEPSAKDKFAEISEAYEVLSDPKKKSDYDQFGFSAGNQAGFSGDPFDIFRQHFGGMGGFEDMFFGGARSSRTQNRHEDVNAPENGHTFRYHITIPFKLSIYGGAYSFDIDHTDPCGTCHGTGVKPGTTPIKCSSCNGSGMKTIYNRTPFGMSMQTSPCPDCHGTGEKSEKCETCHGEKRHSEKKHLTIDIKPGVYQGDILTIKGEGECGLKGGKNGDIQVVLDIEKSELFDRDDFNLTTKLFINPITASLGGTVNVHTPYDVQKLKIPERSMTGDKLTIRGAGIRTADRSGDMIYVLVVSTLVNLDDSQKKILRDLESKMSSTNVAKLNDMNQKLSKFKEK